MPGMATTAPEIGWRPCAVTVNNFLVFLAPLPSLCSYGTPDWYSSVSHSARFASLSSHTTVSQHQRDPSAMRIVVTKQPRRWALLALHTSLLTSLGVYLARQPVLFAHPLQVPQSGAPLHACMRSLGAITWAPIAWNVFPRLEFRHRLLSKLFATPLLAHYVFALYIVLFSSFREHLFFAAINAAPTWPVAVSTLHKAGTAMLALGAFLSAAGFYHLRIRFTYMGEYFGFRMPALITSFPFNVFPDPMYNGSVLMHFGYALRAASPTGFFLASATGLSYWTAAKIFEECVHPPSPSFLVALTDSLPSPFYRPFMMYCYSGQADKDAAAASDVKENKLE